jgi:hypothetical protein
MRLTALAACAVLIQNAACDLPDEPVLNNALDPMSLSYTPYPPQISLVSQNSPKGCWLIVSVIEKYATTLHVERRGGTAREYVEVVTRPAPLQYGFTDSTGVMIVDSVYTYRARVRAPGGGFSAYSQERSIKFRSYPAGVAAAN